MTLRDILSNKPVIYEVVPPKLGSSESEIARRIEHLERVLQDKRIDAINIPELMERKETNGEVTYVPTTIPPEEYAAIIGGSKEKIANIVAPRLLQRDFIKRVRGLEKYDIRNLVLVGKARHSDVLPGPSVVKAMELVSAVNEEHPGEKMGILLGGICIFNRNKKTYHGYEAPGRELDEYERVAIKARYGCRFVTSQINYDSIAAIKFLTNYANYCKQTRGRPVTVFVSLSSIKSLSILSLLTEGLEVYIPSEIRRTLQQEPDRIGELSVDTATEVFSEIIDSMKSNKIDIRIGLHIEQVSIAGADLSLELLDRTYPLLKSL